MTTNKNEIYGMTLERKKSISLRLGCNADDVS